MNERLVTKEDLSVPSCPDCGHAPGWHHDSGDIDNCAGCSHDNEVNEQCGCTRPRIDQNLAHLDSIVRREVAKALREVANQTPSVRITRSGGTATCTVSIGGKPLFIGSAPATEAVIATTDPDNGEWGQS